MKQYGLVLIASIFWNIANFGILEAKIDAIAIKSVSVESMGPNKAARASVVVKTTPTMPVYVYWSDVTTWFPAEGHPNYTISEKAWKDEGYIMLQSTIEIKKVLLEQLSYYYDYDKEHLIYYLPMTADIRSGSGQLIYHQAFDIPEKQASQNYSQARFRIIEKPDELIHYNDGEEVEFRWRFLSRDENEFTLWRTTMHGPTEIHDLDYTDTILYAEDFANTYPDKIKKFDHINVTKNVQFIGRLYLVTFTMKIIPQNARDEGLYVLFLKSRKSLSWEKALNLRISSRLLPKNHTSLLGDNVALALSFCDGSDVRVSDSVAYFGLKPGVENCIKCEAYGNMARDLVLTKDRYLIRPSMRNAVVHSRYYPETKSISYTFRKESENDKGTYFCRAVLRNNDVISRAFQVAWTEDLSLDAKIIYVNQTKALVECKTSAVPKPDLSVWRCVGEVYCSLQSVQTGPNYDVITTEDPTTGTIVTTVSLHMPASDLKREAVMCRATNKFELKEDWLLFDDRVTIEEAQAEEMEEHLGQGQYEGDEEGTGTGGYNQDDVNKIDGKSGTTGVGEQISDGNEYITAEITDNTDNMAAGAYDRPDQPHDLRINPGATYSNNFGEGYTTNTENKTISVGSKDGDASSGLTARQMVENSDSDTSEFYGSGDGDGEAMMI